MAFHPVNQGSRDGSTLGGRVGTDARQAKRFSNGMDHQGRRMTVNEAKPRPTGGGGSDGSSIGNGGERSNQY